MKRRRNIRLPWEPKVATWKSPYAGQKKKSSYNRRVAKALRKARKHRYQDAEGWFSESREKKGRAMSAVQSDVVLALRGQGYTGADAKRLARSASGSDFDSMFRSALSKAKRNPMPKKRSKKRSRKGKMPAGLAAYWAKKRAGKRKAKKSSRRRKRNPRVKTKTVIRTIRKVVYRNPPKRKRRKARKASRRPALRTVRIPGHITPKQRRAIASAISRASGMRVVSKKP